MVEGGIDVGNRAVSCQGDVIGKRRGRGVGYELHSELLRGNVQCGHPFFEGGVLESHPLLEGAVTSVDEADVLRKFRLQSAGCLGKLHCCEWGRWGRGYS